MGSAVGSGDGEVEGTGVGALLGGIVGSGVGLEDGGVEGGGEGSKVGTGVGNCDGGSVGDGLGGKLGTKVGYSPIKATSPTDNNAAPVNRKWCVRRKSEPTSTRLFLSICFTYSSADFIVVLPEHSQ